MKKVLVIEKLNLITFILTLPFSYFFGKVFCTQITPFLKLKAMAKVVSIFRYKIFDYYQITDNYYDVVRDAYDLTEEVYEKIAKEGLVLRLLRKINNNSKLELSIKKQIIVYIENSVFNIYCLNKIISSHSSNSNVSFLPYNLFLYKEIKEKLYSCRVSFLWRAYLFSIEYSSRLYKPILFVCQLLIQLVFVRGITLNQGPTVKYNIGLSIVGQYHDDEMEKDYNNTFIHDGNDFLPSKILHVFDFNRASRESKDYLKKIDAEIGDYYREKVPLTYFLGTIIKYLIFFAISLPLFVLHPKRYSVFIISTMRTIHDLFFMEIFYNHYHVKVHITRDDYSHSHVVRTVVLNERNGKAIGFMHGAMPDHRNVYAYLFLDSYCIWGKINEMFQKHLFKHVNKLEIIGTYRNDYVYNYLPRSEMGEIESLKKHYKIVTIFDEIAEDLNPVQFNKKILRDSLSEFFGRHIDDPGTRVSVKTHKALVEFISHIKMLIEKHKDAYFLIKTKKKENFLTDKYRQLLRGSSPRYLILEHTFPTYGLIGLSDLVVSMSASVAVESFCSGTKTIFYEPYSDKSKIFPIQKHVEKLTNLIFCHNGNDLLDSTAKILNGVYLDKRTEEKLTELLGFKFDGNGIERLREAIRTLY
jgi:hypothetical protein